MTKLWCVQSIQGVCPSWMNCFRVCCTSNQHGNEQRTVCTFWRFSRIAHNVLALRTRCFWKRSCCSPCQTWTSCSSPNLTVTVTSIGKAFRRWPTIVASGNISRQALAVVMYSCSPPSQLWHCCAIRNQQWWVQVLRQRLILRKWRAL